MMPNDQKEIEDIIDVAELFLSASERYQGVYGALKMINEPLGGRLHRHAKYVVFFDFRDYFLLIYKPPWKKIIKFDVISEVEMIVLIKTILSTDIPAHNAYPEEEWEGERFIGLAEEWISTLEKE